MRALRRWREVAGTSPELIFTLCDRDGRRDARGLRPSGVRAVLAMRSSSLTGTAGGPLSQVADALLDTATDVLRDRALLLLGFAMAARRGELTNLVWADVRTADEGLLIRLRRSKTDQLGRGTTLGVPFGRSALTCPVRALQAWRERVHVQLGEELNDQTPIFLGVGRAGRLTHQPLTEEAVTVIVKRRAERAGLEGKWGGRSLRAGLISTAADLDIALDVIAQQSRHASLDSLIRYIRSEDVWRRNAVSRVGM